jgi:hypothetical protein
VPNGLREVRPGIDDRRRLRRWTKGPVFTPQGAGGNGEGNVMNILILLFVFSSCALSQDIYLDENSDSYSVVESLSRVFTSAESRCSGMERRLFRQKDMLDEDFLTKLEYFDHMIKYGQATKDQRAAYITAVLEMYRAKYEYLYELSQAAPGEQKARVFAAYRNALHVHGTIARMAARF